MSKFKKGVDYIRSLMLDIYTFLRRPSPLVDAGGAEAGRLLIVDEHVPDPRLGAGYPRSREMLKSVLEAGWSVSYCLTTATRLEVAEIRRQIGVAVGFKRVSSPVALARVLERNAGKYDAILLSRPSSMAAAREVERLDEDVLKNIYCIYDAESVFANREALRRRLFGKEMRNDEYEDSLCEEIRLCSSADAIIAVNEIEADIFRARTSADIHVVGHSQKCLLTEASFSQRKNFLFVGRLDGDRRKSPNVDSLVWFVQNIMPFFDQYIFEEYKLIVVGVVLSEDIRKISSDKVEFVGAVDDLSSLYNSSRVVIAPTRFSAGIPNKVHEAAARGVPCVATTVIASQAGFSPEVEILAADDERGFAMKCANLYQDPRLWENLRISALNRVSTICSPARFDEGVRAVLKQATSIRRTAGTRAGSFRHADGTGSRRP